MIFEEALRGKQLTQTELAVVSYITAHPQQASHMAVRELAEAAFVSSAAVMRLCKKLGFASFNDMKVELARELATSDAYSDVDADYPELSRASHAQVTSTLASMEGSAIKKTERMLAQVDWRPILATMAKASGISVYATGFSMLATESFCQHIRRLGMSVTCLTDPSFAWHWAGNCPRSEFSVIVSYTGETPYVLGSARILYKRGCKAVSVTAAGDNALKRLTTFNLPLALTERRFANNRVGSFQSTIETQFALDVLYAQLFAQDYEANTRRVQMSLEQQGAQFGHVGDDRVSLDIPSLGMRYQ